MNKQELSASQFCSASAFNTLLEASERLSPVVGLATPMTSICFLSSCHGKKKPVDVLVDTVDTAISGRIFRFVCLISFTIFPQYKEN